MTEKLNLIEKISAIDSNIRELWDACDDVNKKALKNEMYILNRWVSSVDKQPAQVVKHYLIMTNELYNKHYFTLTQHPKLLWLLLCMTSYNNKPKFHKWIALSKKSAVSDKHKIVETMYPHLNADEVDLLANQMSTEEAIELAEEYAIDISLKPKTKKKKKA